MSRRYTYLLMAGLLPWGHCAAATPAANIISIQGQGQFRSEARSDWADARVEQGLVAGEFVRTGADSRMGVLFLDRTQLRLNEKTVLQVKEAEGSTRIGLAVGRVWTQSKTLPDKLLMETPAATAAIRGTDWEIEVAPDGRTVLTVLSGEVEFFNPQGRLVVRKNEAAEARVGSAPIRLMVVRPQDRVQWVAAHALEPLRRIAISGLAADPAVRASDTARWPIGEDPAKVSSPRRDAGAYDPADAGLLALQRGEFEAARSHFTRAAAPDGPQAERLALGRISLLMLERRLREARTQLQELTARPVLGDAAPYLLLSDIALQAGDIARARSDLNDGIARFPADTRLQAALARIHLLADEQEKARAILASARRADADAVDPVLALGELERIEGNAAAASTTFAEAIRLAPDDDRGWYGLGRVNAEREDIRIARVQLARALELHAAGVGYRGELGTLESLANNFDAARSAFEAALAQHPDDYVALTGLGLLELKRGRTDAALDAFLRAGIMEPRYARAATYTAVTYYQQGRVQPALAELARASTLDDKDPLPHLLASIIHTDTLHPALAIESARKALRLLPYLKSLNQLANDQQGLTNLGQSFAFLGMEEWAHAYAQESYYPFWAGSHLFLADRYAGLYTKNSELFQGLITDPTVFGGSNRFQSLIPRPGHHGSASMRYTSAESFHGFSPQLRLNGYVNDQLPWAYLLDHEQIDLHRDDGPHRQHTTTAALGLTPRHDLNVLLFADDSRLRTRLRGDAYVLDDKLTAGRADLALAYKPGPASQLLFKGGRFDSRDKIEGPFFGEQINARVRVRLPEWSLRHTFMLTPGHELGWGIDDGRRSTTSHYKQTIGIPDELGLIIDRITENSRDIYVSSRWQASPEWLLQTDLFHQHHRRSASQSNFILTGNEQLPFSASGERLSDTRLSPRFGFVYRLEQGAQFRLAYQRWLRPAVFSSLGPVATAGIVLDDRMVMRGGELERLRGQFEWEMGLRSFAQLYFDLKDIDNRRFSRTPFTINELESLAKLRPRRLGSLANDDMLEFANTPEYDGGRIRSGGLAFNHLLSDQWGLFGRYVYTASRNSGRTYAGNGLPFLPRHTVAGGATWVAPDGWYFISRLVHRSERFRDEANLDRLQQGWGAAFDLYWQSPDKRWMLRLSMDDALDPDKDTQYTTEVNLRF